MLFFRKRNTRFAPPTLTSQDAYRRWAQNYPPFAHNVLMQTEEKAVLALLPDLRDKVVLDLACGSGRYGLIAAQLGAKHTIGVDNSMAMLLANPTTKRTCSTTEALPLQSESIDVILCGLALGHLPTLRPSMSEIARVLKVNGHAVISDFHPFMFLSGGRRTFADEDGKTFAVEHYAHLYTDYHHTAAECGMVIDAVLEPSLAEQAQPSPVVIVYRLRKAAARYSSNP